MQPEKNKKSSYATIKDVAAYAGTSTTTVSHVLNENSKRPISAGLRARVLEACEKLNYSKSAIATGLRKCHTGTVAIMIPQFSNIYYTRACQSAEDLLLEAGIQPVIFDTREDAQREKLLIEMNYSNRVDGIILGPSDNGWENTSILRERNIPFVVMGRELMEHGEVHSDGVYYVSDNSYQAGKLAAEHLISNGHRRIGIIEWSGKVSSALDRDLGFMQTINTMLDDNARMEMVSSKLVNETEGYNMTAKIMETANHITALFYGYHRHALGGVQYLIRHGYRIPEDISVVMIGTPAWSRMSNPEISRIYQQEEWVGRKSAEMLMSLMDEDLRPLVEQRQICECSLIEGGSVRKIQ